jgi:DNA polymerase III epsilon subunit-like protein
MEMSKAAKHFPNKLSDCCARAGIAYVEAHCALPDAIMCARVFKNFFEDPKDEEYAMALQEVRMKEEAEAEAVYKEQEAAQSYFEECVTRQDKVLSL